jgi:hypothetical protein
LTRFVQVVFTQATRDKKKLVHDDIMVHRQLIIVSRQGYHRRRNLGRFNLGKMTSIIIDAMDQVGIIAFVYMQSNDPISTNHANNVFVVVVVVGVGVGVVEQAKTHIPFSSSERMTQLDVTKRLCQRIHGAIIHGTGTFLYVVEQMSVPKGANQGEWQNTHQSLHGPF